MEIFTQKKYMKIKIKTGSTLQYIVYVDWLKGIEYKLSVDIWFVCF